MGVVTGNYVAIDFYAHYVQMSNLSKTLYTSSDIILQAAALDQIYTFTQLPGSIIYFYPTQLSNIIQTLVYNATFLNSTIMSTPCNSNPYYNF
jgi:hypothetical protein